jgi:hypothetical protein
MAVEHQRGISVSSAVTSFKNERLTFVDISSGREGGSLTSRVAAVLIQ